MIREPGTMNASAKFVELCHKLDMKINESRREGGIECTLLLPVNEVSASHFKATRDLSCTEHPAALDLEISDLPHPQWSQLCLHD